MSKIFNSVGPASLRCTHDYRIEHYLQEINGSTGVTIGWNKIKSFPIEKSKSLAKVYILAQMRYKAVHGLKSYNLANRPSDI